MKVEQEGRSKIHYSLFFLFSFLVRLFLKVWNLSEIHYWETIIALRLLHGPAFDNLYSPPITARPITGHKRFPLHHGIRGSLVISSIYNYSHALLPPRGEHAKQEFNHWKVRTKLLILGYGRLKHQDPYMWH